MVQWVPWYDSDGNRGQYSYSAFDRDHWRGHGRSDGGLDVADLRIRRAGVRAGQPVRAHRRRHPDDAQFDEGSPTDRHRRAGKGDVVRAVFTPQSPMGYGRRDARAADAGIALRRTLSVHAPWRSARGAALGGA